MRETSAKNVQINVVDAMELSSNAHHVLMDIMKQDGIQTDIQYAKNVLETARVVMIHYQNAQIATNTSI